MKNTYQRAMDEVHAPQQLVARTQAAVRAAQSADDKDAPMQPQKKLVRFPVRRIVAAAAAFVVLCAGVATFALRTPQFSTLPAGGWASGSVHSFGLIDPMRREVSLETFDAAFGSCLAQMDLSDAVARILYDESDVPVNGNVQALYEGANLSASAYQDGLPAALLETTPISLTGVLVHLAKTQNSSLVMAGFTIGDVTYYLSSDTLSERAFASTVKHFLQTCRG